MEGLGDRQALLEDSETAGAGEGFWNTKEIRSRQPNWQSLRDAKRIDDAAYEWLTRFQREPLHTQQAYCSEDSQRFCHSFLSVLRDVSQPEALLYSVTTLDELMKEGTRQCASMFKQAQGTALDPITIVANLINDKGDDDLLLARSCNIACNLFQAGLQATDDSTTKLMDFVKRETAWVREKRDCRRKIHAFLAVLNVLQGLLRANTRRIAFMEAGGMNMLLPLIKEQTSNPQLLYQVCHCIWLLSYCSEVRAKLADMVVVAPLVHVLKGTQKEKVIRMILATFVNLIDTADMKGILSVCGAQRLLDSMKQRSWSDEDITADIETLTTKVGQNVEAMSTFDEYSKEVLSGELEWTPIHRSPTFWEKNVHKFVEKDLQILRVLVQLITPGYMMDSKRVPDKVLAIALHDVGEFVRAHPAGKGYLIKLDAKRYIMGHLTSSAEEVSKEALTCVQKLMVH
mmetsp:Transcript_40928/g.83747  ORF Transcript_40928/g.83747 Transcript_40928/m.83747 type:complete len:457 (+) Transcript_40928:140-1510(+)